MNINLRKAVLNNLNNASFDNIKATIEDAISIDEEKALPGLGVMFEVLWKKASPDLKKTIINNIVQAVS
jgi:small acid-soluble spore protein I (minor)